MAQVRLLGQKKDLQAIAVNDTSPAKDGGSWFIQHVPRSVERADIPYGQRC